MIFLIVSLSTQSKNYIGELSKLYSKEVVAVGTTNRIDFSTEVTIIKGDGNTQDFFQLDLKNGSGFMSLNSIKISPINSVKEGNRFYFKSSFNGEGIQEIRFLLEGELIFNWLIKNKRDENIRMGYINSSTNPVYLNLRLEDFNPVYSLKVRVVDNMNLGKGQAGEKLSTKTWGTPANVSVEGEESKRVSITIPQSTVIKNSRDDKLTVNLNFRENSGQKLIKELAPNSRDTFRVGSDGRVISKDILIDGETQTTRGSRGAYRGSFTVKVEYLD